jgi:hypothetical protein
MDAVEALQRRLEPHFRTHLGALAAGALERDELVARQLSRMTPEQRAQLVARIAEELGNLNGG